uniref:Anaphase-promoting complex subunit 4 WD40 domain-containing protein n=1 Tax=Rhizochromulina marina TaxID=1034831 RepID=A0A7S2S1D7_9STRA|mmetsp:Transcript_23785/g.69665  ORF Transcript_23785/g.69665 Transcript_23785/m.69665 type:complete len:456 (+) Transcript_23785:95-1462(+)
MAVFEESGSSMNSVSFASGGDRLVLGTGQGFAVLSREPFRILAQSWIVGPVHSAELVPQSALLALVGPRHREAVTSGPGSSRRLRLWSHKSQSAICEVPFESDVLAVRLSRSRLVVVLVDTVFMFDLGTMDCLQTLDTLPNPLGLAALASNPENPVLALPAEDGVVVLYDTFSLRLLNRFAAHRGRLACMAFNGDGSLLATASETGTVIRVFGSPSGTRVSTLRRGTVSCRILAMAFSPSSTLLAVSSSTGTCHVFRLPDFVAADVTTTSQGSETFRLETAGAGGLVGYLGSVINEYMDNVRHHAWARIPGEGLDHLACALVQDVDEEASGVLTEDPPPAGAAGPGSVESAANGIRAASTPATSRSSGTADFLVTMTSLGLYQKFRVPVEPGTECVLVEERRIRAEQLAQQQHPGGGPSVERPGNRPPSSVAWSEQEQEEDNEDGDGEVRHLEDI